MSNSFIECGSCGAWFPDNHYMHSLCLDCSMIGQVGLLNNAKTAKEAQHFIRNITILAKLKMLTPEKQNTITNKELEGWYNSLPVDKPKSVKVDDVETVQGLLEMIAELNKRHPTIELSIFLRSNVTGESYLEEKPPKAPKSNVGDK